MNEYHLKMQLMDELKTAIRVKEINEKLLETLQSSLMWLLRYCEANKIELKDKDHIFALLEKSHQLIQQIYPDLPTKSYQPDKTPNNLPVYTCNP